VALGGEVAGFKVGDPVFGLLPPTRPGAYAEFAVVRADEVAVFRGMSFAAAAGVPMAGLTAWQALFEHGRLEKGRTVLLVGDDWPVLNLAVQLARWRGAMVLVAAPMPLHDRLLELGADQVVDIAHERLEKVPEADLVIDLVGGKEGGRGWAVLKRGGRMVSLIDEPDEEKSRELGMEATRVAVQPSSEQLTQLASLLREQKIRVIDPELFTPAQAAKAHAKFEQAYRQGKLVIMAPKPPLHDPPHDRGAFPIPRS
jgi:NADPH:quinone reductase-like Zn-dependent oxidoreductase